jgi:superfamily I DNA and RNA helicase
MDEHRKIEAINAARREIARRIARVCASLSPEEFEKLLDRMAGIQWKYEVLPNISDAKMPDAVQLPNRTRDGNPPA